jgi:hypothetical protein
MSPLPNRQDELEEFKQIDLVNYARSYGYKPVRGEPRATPQPLKMNPQGIKSLSRARVTAILSIFLPMVAAIKEALLIFAPPGIIFTLLPERSM